MELIKAEILKSLEKAGVKNPVVEKPPKGIDSDLAFPCFNLAKELKKNPVEIAKELAPKLKPQYVKAVEAIGPYVNFHIDWEKVGGLVLEEILTSKTKYGSVGSRSKEKIIMDVYQANPFKSFHIGHVRNAVLGDSVRRLLEFTGRNVTTVSYNGDVGTHVARWLWYYNNFYKGLVPKKDFTKWAGQIYASSSKKADENEKYKEEIDGVNRKLDKRDPEILKEWKKFRGLCYVSFSSIAKEMGIKVDNNIPESECEGPGKTLVKSLYKKGKLVESEGTIGIDLKGYNLGFFILLKSDGTALYSTKDFGLLQQKSKLGKFDRFLYVVGSEQDMYFQQLFKAYELLKLSAAEHHHISHGLVTLKEGKMASRLGNVILYEDLRDEMVGMATKLIEEKNPKLKNKKDVAKEVAFAAIKFSMLNIENHKFIKFDWDQALDINGRSGPYLQYACVRARSILKKAGKTAKFDSSLLKEKEEIDVLKALSEFPEVVLKSANAFSPYILTNYLFDLAQSFNSFYQSVQVLNSEPKTKAARLALVKAGSFVIESGLNLLGIGVPEEM